MRYRPELDGLRAVAIAGVVASHTYPGLPVAGWLGVDVFFVLSGYLITTILLAEREQTGRISLRAFYSRRVFRLGPAAVVAVAGALLLGVVTLPHALLAIAYVGNFASARHEGVMQGLSQMWSLAQEEQFYAIWPVMLLGMRRWPPWRALRWTLTAAALSAIAWALTSTAGAPDTIGYLPVFRAGGMLMGCAVAIAIQAGMVKRSAMLAPLSILALGLSAYLRQVPSAPSWLLVTTASVSTAGLLAGLAVSGGVVKRALALRPLPYLGRLSYSLYLWHLPVLWFAIRHDVAPGGATIAAALGLAAISYHAVERPFLRLRDARRRRTRLDTQSPAVVPTF